MRPPAAYVEEMGRGQHGLADLLQHQRTALVSDESGTVSQGNPLLASASADCFALAAVDVRAPDEIHATAEADQPFSLQSVVKPWLYAVALGDHGDAAHEHIGVEPTGEPFDALVLEAETGRPPNAMVNAGALVSASLVDGRDVDERVERVLEVCSRAAGRELAIDEKMAAHELEHGDRNRALGYLASSSGALRGSVEDALEVLCRACAITVTATDLALMAGTLATWGRHPRSDDTVLSAAVVTEVLSVMATCGMYDGAGRWVHRVGMPAKSGVSGALMAVAPGLMGIGTFSPPLDDHGNSVRGVRACEALSQQLGLHRFSPPGAGATQR